MAALFAGKPPRVSFEFFPPNSAKMEETLWESITTLAPLNPAFVSITYGAGGSTRERTHQTLQRVVTETSLTPAAHLTSVSASQADVLAVAESYHEMGIRHIVALRGDAPDAARPYVPHSGGFAYASDLVRALKKLADFDVTVAAYPEGHPETPGMEADIENLNRKVDAGANRAITQYFFDVEHFLRYRDKAVAAGVNIPIVPGLLPVTNYAQMVKFSAMCGASVPDWLAQLFAGLEDDATTRMHVAVAVATEQCRRLRKEGVENFHFYTLNRAELTLALCHVLGVRKA